jgi:hypothetical protein
VAGVLDDVLGLVGDALQVGDDLRGVEEEPHVPSDRLVEGGQAHGLVVDLDLEGVDLVLLGEDDLGVGLVALDQRAHGQLDHRLGQRAHDDDLLEDVLKLFVEVTDHFGQAPARDARVNDALTPRQMVSIEIMGRQATR